jgi:hypothetical protein
MMNDTLIRSYSEQRHLPCFKVFGALRSSGNDRNTCTLFLPPSNLRGCVNLSTIENNNLQGEKRDMSADTYIKNTRQKNNAELRNETSVKRIMSTAEVITFANRYFLQIFAPMLIKFREIDGCGKCSIPL